MKVNKNRTPVLRSAGYSALIERFGLEVIPNWHTSLIGSGGSHQIDKTTGQIEEIYPAKYWPGDKTSDHLEFALKYDGVNPAILATLFQVMPEEELLSYLKAKPLGKYARRLWFLFELLTRRPLSLDDLKRGTYVDALDPKQYYTASGARQVRRQRVIDNLLGDARFCPMIRRTNVLKAFEAADLAGRCRAIVSEYPPQLLKRAMSYLYTKETKSSFEIEHIKPGSSRIERFVALLHLAASEDFCEKRRLIELQNRIVDPRFQAPDYRTCQNYVGEAVAWQGERIHFVSPKPEDLAELMDGWSGAHTRMEEGGVSAVAHAAAIAYGFVFLHPFEDGNGRIHRFLIHNVLARRGFTPEGTIFPISATMLKNLSVYDESLEAFSKPVMKLVEYALDENGCLTVHNETARWYRYIDMTPQVEALFRFIDTTIETELTRELAFLANYDRTKAAIQEIVDMPDRLIDLFIRACLQNNGRLSARKRASHFDFLSDEEVARLEKAVQSGYRNE